VAAPVISAAEWAWQRQSVWSQTADALKSEASRVRGARLVLTVTAAVLALSASQVKAVSGPASLVLAVAAALMLTAVGLLRGRANVEQVRRWTRARSVAEALKTDVYLFLANPDGGELAERERRLEADVQRMEREVGDLQRYTEGIHAKDRPLPEVHDMASYLDVRVRRGQLEDYYERKARLMRQRLRQMKIIEVTLALVAAALAALATVSADVSAWAAVITTAAGAVAAYAAAERFEYLWIEYSRTASELRRLLDRRTAVDGRRLSDAELVKECEGVISVQNQAWMSQWGEEKP
jgi:cell division protein FtsB